MEICLFKIYIQKDSLVTPFMDKMAEWLKRWTVNPLVSARVGTNPIFVVFLIGSTVKWIAICCLNIFIRAQISEKTCLLYTSPSPRDS